MAMTRKARRFARRGAAAIEYGLIAPALLLFVIGLIDTGRLFWSYTTLNRAAAAAARCGAINTTACGTTAQIQNFAVSEAWGMTIDASAFTVSTRNCGVSVVGNYAFTFLTPGFNYVVPLGTVTLNATACYPK
ncbi:MAG TPA: TadE family protein [Pseudolabrys sp.]|nr:TadE family protein [Pseudolabrys sp.]